MASKTHFIVAPPDQQASYDQPMGQPVAQNLRQSDSRARSQSSTELGSATQGSQELTAPVLRNIMDLAVLEGAPPEMKQPPEITEPQRCGSAFSLIFLVLVLPPVR